MTINITAEKFLREAVDAIEGHLHNTIETFIINDTEDRLVDAAVMDLQQLFTTGVETDLLDEFMEYAIEYEKIVDEILGDEKLILNNLDTEFSDIDVFSGEYTFRDKIIVTARYDLFNSVVDTVKDAFLENHDWDIIGDPVILS